MAIIQAFVWCHDILIMGKSPLKWRQLLTGTLVVDWDVKHQFKQIQYSVDLLNTFGMVGSIEEKNDII